jgi:hypothetical protein
MEGHGVPEEMREQIHANFTPTERLIWFGRPDMKVLIYLARRFQLMGALMGFGVLLLAPLGAYYCYTQGITVGIFVLSFFALAFGAVGVYALGAPGRQRRSADRRACFAITNRRLLIHPGNGTQTLYGQDGGVAVVPRTGEFGVSSYAGLQLTNLMRSEMARIKGAGEIIFGRSLLDQPSGGSLWALANALEVEKVLREKLIHPVIDKLLRGESLQLDVQTSSKGSGEEVDVVPGDKNIKDYFGAAAAGGTNAKAAPGGAVGNVKTVAFGLKYDPQKVPAGQREQVEAELAAGEKILWIGTPEGGVKKRGMLGKMMGSAERIEPFYTLYALTNRRVLLWSKPGWHTSDRKIRKWKPGQLGPVSYYPTSLRGVDLEPDDRVKDGGGSVIVKTVKRTYWVQTQNRGQKKVTQMFYFGLLRVRQFKAVAYLLYETLIAPCKGL